MQRVLATLLSFLLLTGTALSHPSDVSHLRVKLDHARVEFRLTFNLLTLSRMVVVDSDHDRRITPEEIAKAMPVVVDWLKKKVLVNVNGTDADLGDFQRYECVWPNSDKEAVTDQEASQRFVDIHFLRTCPAGVQDVWMGFQIFAEVGDQHTVQAIYQQEGQPDLPVDFTQLEPEYLYDTGWASIGSTDAVARASNNHGWFAIASGMLALAGALAGWIRWRRGVEKPSAAG